MATESLCALLVNGLDVGCDAPTRKYYQQAVLINKSDIDPTATVITKPDPETETCAYTVEFTLKEGKTGYKFIGPSAGSTFVGSFDKSRNDLGYAQYIHNPQILITGIDEATKCILDALDKGSFIVALQLKDETVEIYGFVNGLTTGDYTYNIQEGGGGTPVILSSLEDAPESSLPFVYKSGTPGEEGADFDDAFSNIVSV